MPVFDDGPLQPLQLQNFNYSISHFTAPYQRDQFDLHAPYQRGSVWGPQRQADLIRSVLLGIPVGTITLNNRGIRTSGTYAVIDGAQRIQALRAFVDDQLPVPASWFAATDRPGTEGAATIVYSDLTDGYRVWFGMRPLSASEGQVKTIAEEAEIFRLINTGGVAQTDTDLARAAAIERSAL